MSSAAPIPFNGWTLLMWTSCSAFASSGDVRAEAVTMVLSAMFIERQSIHTARTDGIDVDSMRCAVKSCCFSEPNNGMLRRTICHLISCQQSFPRVHLVQVSPLPAVAVSPYILERLIIQPLSPFVRGGCFIICALAARQPLHTPVVLMFRVEVHEVLELCHIGCGFFSSGAMPAQLTMLMEEKLVKLGSARDTNAHIETLAVGHCFGDQSVDALVRANIDLVVESRST